MGNPKLPLSGKTSTQKCHLQALFRDIAEASHFPGSMYLVRRII
jgi:hypothetical protein